MYKLGSVDGWKFFWFYFQSRLRQINLLFSGFVPGTSTCVLFTTIFVLPVFGWWRVLEVFPSMLSIAGYFVQFSNDILEVVILIIVQKASLLIILYYSMCLYLRISLLKLIRLYVYQYSKQKRNIHIRPCHTYVFRFVHWSK